MSIPKGTLQSVMKYSRIIKSDESDLPIKSKSDEKLTFKKSLEEPPVETLTKNLMLPDPLMLSGSEKKSLSYLCQKKEKYENGKVVTKPVNLAIMSNEMNISVVTLKKSIQRIEKKGFICRVNFKSGRDGWTIYSIQQSIFKAFINAFGEQKNTEELT